MNTTLANPNDVQANVEGSPTAPQSVEEAADVTKDHHHSDVSSQNPESSAAASPLITRTTACLEETENDTEETAKKSPVNSGSEPATGAGPPPAPVSSAASTDTTLPTTVEKLDITSKAGSLADPYDPASPNPWNDEIPSAKERPVTIPDSASVGQSAFQSDSPIPPSKPSVPVDVLNEFDPLSIQEEKAAKDAWESAESHPPPPRTPSPPPPSPPEKDSTPKPSDSASKSPSTSSDFPSFASLARTFALPLTPLARARPQSIDVARPVPSPATLSSFASQQQQQQQQQAQQQRQAEAHPSRSSTPLAAGSGTASPVPSTRGDRPAEGQFDFQKFLDQMKSKSAEPVSKYLRSFLSNFAKRSFTVNDQVKIINDFLSFIAQQMRNTDVWKNATDEEFDNAMEGMEKLVMNRLYEFTFTPQLQQAQPPRPITTDDLERDKVLSQRIALFGWIEEKHLDIPEGEGGKGFLMFAQQELLKINHYKAPRDKLICILNCCKVIFGLIRHLKKEEGADSFLPILIFVVLKANPEHLLSNVEFINRFRNPEKLQSEAGYYLSSLMGAVSFIETMDHTSLSNIDQEEFEKNVEAAIQALPPSEPPSPQTPFAESKVRPHIPQSHAGEESAQPLSLSTPSQSLSDDAKRLLQKTGDTISKPLNAIGRIFSEALDGAENKLAYLPGPFAPFELGREQRQQGGMMGDPHSAGLPPHPGSAGAYPHQQQQQWPPHSAPAGSAPNSAGAGHGAWPHPQGTPNYQSYPATPQSAGYTQTPYGQEGGGAYGGLPATPYKARQPKRVYSPNGPWGTLSPGASPGGYGYASGGDETPSRAGPHTHQPLAIGPSQPPLPALVPPRVSSLAQAESGANISRTPTPNLDLAAVQQQIDAAQQAEVRESRKQLAQIFPDTDAEIVDWVLEANGGDLGKSIEALLEMNSGD